MASPITSKKKAQAISTALALVGLAVLIFTGAWWPGIMCVVGLSLALRHYLLGRIYDMCITLLVFLGAFITVQFDISWRLFLPILFTIGAIYILCREFITPEEVTEEDKENDAQHEIEEDKKK